MASFHRKLRQAQLYCREQLRTNANRESEQGRGARYTDWQSMPNIAKWRFASVLGMRIDRMQWSAFARGGYLLFCLLLLVPVPAFLMRGQRPEHPAKPPARSPSDASRNAGSFPEERIRFEDLIEKSGIRFQLKNSISPQRFSIETMLGGVAVFDYNNDGLLDIFFTNGAAIPSLEKTDPSYWNRLYRNNGDGTFTDVTERAGLQGTGYC